MVILVKIISVTGWTQKPEFRRLKSVWGVRKAELAMVCFCDVRELSLLKSFGKRKVGRN